MAAILWALPVANLDADRTALAARDYSNFWAAGRFVLNGHMDILFDHAKYNSALQALFGKGFIENWWLYPPPALLLAVPLAKAPLFASFVLFTLSTVVALWFALRAAGLSAAERWAVLVCPALVDNALAGQHGALVGALLLGGLFLLEKRPVLAGLLIGALAFKPSFALLAPVCIIASGQWRAFFSAAASACAIAALSAVLFGVTPWLGFLQYTQPTVSGLLEMPWHEFPGRHIFISPFSAMRSVGADVAIAYSVQFAVTLLCVALAWRAWRRQDIDRSARVALTAVLALLATPWCHTYDMILMAAAIVVLYRTVERSYLPFLGLAWFWPGAVLFLPIPTPFSVGSTMLIAWIAWTQMNGENRTLPSPGIPIAARP